jgi:Dihydrofolate reductase
VIVSLIVAYDRARGIGRGNRLPWRLPAEMQHFKRTTMGKPIVMGRRTFESIGRALPGRRNIVITRGMSAVDGVEQARSLAEALQLDPTAVEVMVIGGAALYAASLPWAHKVHATEIDGIFDTDTRFPDLDPAQWREASRHYRPADPANPFAMDFVIYDRVP